MYYTFLLAKFLASSLPRSGAYAVAKFFALIHYCFSSKDREAVRFNLSFILSDPQEIKKYSKQVFINFAYYLTDFFRYSKLNHKFIKKYVKVSGLEHLQWAKSQNMPTICLSAHLGNYELAGAVSSLLGYPVAAVALTHKDKRANELFDKQRRRVGMKVIAPGNTIRNCLSSLKEGDLLALLGDRDFAKSGYKLNFFSHKTNVPRGVGYFALKSKACIIPGFLIRENKYYYNFRFEEPLCYEDFKNLSEEEIMIKCIPIMERYIRKYPDQWYIFTKFWDDAQAERGEEKEVGRGK